MTKADLVRYISKNSLAVLEAKNEARKEGVSSWKNLRKQQLRPIALKLKEREAKTKVNTGVYPKKFQPAPMDQELAQFLKNETQKVLDGKLSESIYDHAKKAAKAKQEMKAATQKMEKPKQNTPTGLLDLALVELVKQHDLGMSKDEIEEIVKNKMDAEISDIHTIVTDKVEALVSPAPKEIVINKPELKKDPKNIGVQHFKFQSLLMASQTFIANNTRRINVWLHGPPATGKTTAAANVAKALDLKFYFTGAIDMPFQLIGYNDANGNLVRTPFREAYENGGVFLFDEVDGSAPAAVLALNAAIDGDIAAFPDGMIKRHKDFVCIAGANTVGNGGGTEFSGRAKQDEAFRSRWVFLEWDHDEALEQSIVGNCAKAKDWLKTVKKARRIAKTNGVSAFFSTRASIHGKALLEAGWSKAMVIDAVLRAGMPKESWKYFEGNL